MKKYRSGTIIILTAVLFVVILISQSAFREHSTEKPQTLRQVQIPEIPARMDFAGERVPLDNWDVKERLERELLFNFYNTPNVIYTLKLANRYFPVISERLKANGVPDDFKYLCVAESNLVPNAISRSGATSFWQFMNNTAPEYQLSVNEQIDERYNLELATDAACKYFKKAYAKFGSWTAAAASYNCGMTGYSNQAGFQKTNNYYDLQLPEETARYIFRILTFKHLLSNAEALGFKLSEEDKYKPVPFKEIAVTQSVPDLAAFAIQNGTTYRLLKLMNPWIKGKSLTVASGRTIMVKIPEKP